MESLGSLVFHVGRHFGWDGQVLLNYGSVEFLGPYVDVVSRLALALTAIAFAWLLLWRLRVQRFRPHARRRRVRGGADVHGHQPGHQPAVHGVAGRDRRGLPVLPGSRMTLPVTLVLAACFATVLEFPIWFSHVVGSDRLGITLLFVRNGLLVVAALIAALELWWSTCLTRPRPCPLRPPGSKERLSSS